MCTWISASGKGTAATSNTHKDAAQLALFTPGHLSSVVGRGTTHVTRSGTRREELLFAKDDLSKMNVLRRIISPMGTMDGIEFLISKIKNTKNNSDFFTSMNKSN